MIAVFVALSINGIGLMALLMQGCQKPPETTLATPPEPTNATPAFVEPTNTPAEPTNVAVEPAPAMATTQASNPAPVEPVTSPAVPSGGAEYSVAKGDTFGSLAKKFHVSVKAIADANPGVDPTKLKIDQKIHIPAASAPVAPSAAGTSSAEPTPGGERTYSVKSGDNLSTIAKDKGVTVKALRAANNLKTDRITVGQKLKIPAKATTTPAEPASGASTNGR